LNVRITAEALEHLKQNCIMCFIATALSTEIHKDIWQMSLTRPMSGTTSFSQTSQLEGMRAFETKLGCRSLAR
jgi:hypothetical protein